MFRLSVTSRYGTALVVLAGLASVFGVAQSEGTYSQEDSKALLEVLDAPGVSPAADPSFAAPPAATHWDVSSLRDQPQSLDALSMGPESKRFDSWDIKGGTIVPEPATALLTGAGLAALAVLRALRGRAGIE